LGVPREVMKSTGGSVSKGERAGVQAREVRGVQHEFLPVALTGGGKQSTKTLRLDGD